MTELSLNYEVRIGVIHPLSLITSIVAVVCLYGSVNYRNTIIGVAFVDGDVVDHFYMPSFGSMFWWYVKILFYSVTFARSWGVKFSFDSGPIYLRRRPTKEILDRFIAQCRVKFMGFKDIMIPNIAGVLHPIDYFIDGLYRILNEPARLEAYAVYKRTNPTLQLRLDQVDKYGDDFVLAADVKSRLNEVWTEMMDEVFTHEYFPEFIKDVNSSVAGDFFALNIDGSSAAGFPYPAGVKRRDVLHEAIEKSSNLLNDDASFVEYMRNHVWYTTGRAKLQEVAKELSARLICYSGFSCMLVCMLYAQPWQKFMNLFSWCAVGMSWMHGGCAKFAKHFGDVGGFAPEGYEYCVVDMKSWDAYICSDLLHTCKRFHVGLMVRCGVTNKYILRFVRIMEDMIEAVILFPMGYSFQAKRGMKSGWCNTANDNTLIHEFIFRCIEKKFNVKMHHVLYGDDNFFLRPLWLDIESIRMAYEEFGVVVGKIHSSSRLEEVDFLSKRIRFFEGEYTIYRPSVETHARLLMPEEMDPSRRDVPDSRIAAERLIGHLIDNPFNVEVRESIYNMLRHIKEHYHIDEIIVDEDMLRRPPWRFMDPNRVRGVIPIIPDFDFICQLYGVGVVPTLISWPRYDLNVIRFDMKLNDVSCGRFFGAQLYYQDVWNRLLTLTRKKRKLVSKMTSPFVGPRNARGYHGGRFEFATTYFGIDYKKALDFGSHPGAAAFSMLKKCDDITCVTLVPEHDKHPLPYVVKRKGLKFVNQDVDDFKFVENYDLLHDDVDVVGVRPVNCDRDLAIRALARMRKGCGKVKHCLLTVHEMSADVMMALYDTYRLYGHFDIVKPYYSNPWKPQFMVHFKRTKDPPVRRRVFLNALYKFLNLHSSMIVAWSEVLDANVNSVLDGSDATICPIQKDTNFIKFVEDKLYQ